MHTFFQGWRRKAGVVTLIVACMLMGVWLKTMFSKIGISVPFGRRGATIELSVDGFAWTTIEPGSSWSVEKWKKEYGFLIWWDPADSGSVDKFGIDDGHLAEWHRDWGGFHLGLVDHVHAGALESIVIVPHWFIVLPLTLLSAYLLLWKPRTAANSRLPQS
jgi:hypothetical protein